MIRRVTVRAMKRERWSLGDPIERLKNHLIGLGNGPTPAIRNCMETRGTVNAEWKALTFGTMNDGPRLVMT
jgi:hypothetical protein